MIDMMNIFIYTIAASGLAIASITDIKTREVHDWLSYFLVIAGLGIRLLYSILQWDFYIFIDGVIGFGIFFGIALLMFYAKQWGGGDSKILMGIGALVGFDVRQALSLRMPFLLDVFIDILLVGAVYGILYSVVLSLKNLRGVTKSFKKMSAEKKNLKIFVLVAAFAIALSSLFLREIFLRFAFLSFAIMIIVMLYLNFFIKSVEKECMLKSIEPEKLTEGDWIAKKIVVDGKFIAGPDDLGIEEKQIRKLIKLKNEGKIRKVLIKEGIPFIPSFLVGFILAVIYGNLFLYLIH